MFLMVNFAIKPAHAVPLESARKHPENQKENQAGHSPGRAVMAVFLLFSCRAAGMGNLINSFGGRWVGFSRETQIRTAMRLSSRFCVFCGAKPVKAEPGAAPEDL